MCPKCGHLLDKNSYFNKWECMNRDCNYKEEIKNNQWIELLVEMSLLDDDGNIVAKQIPSNKEIMDKVNEIISVINKLTNPRV